MSRSSVFFTQVRTYVFAPKTAPNFWKANAVKYDNVTYYPRFPNHKDPPITPTKLLMIRRVKTFKYQPWWDKNILAQLKLTDKSSEIVIVKNIPEICALVWKVKHLVEVIPINMPNELPEENEKFTYLHENGDLLLAPRVDPEREKVTEKFLKSPKKLDSDTLRRELRMRWSNPYDL